MKLYRKDARGVVRFWEVEPLSNGLSVSWGQVGGAVQCKFEPVRCNQSGRGLDEQIQLEMNSLIAKKRDHGYVEDSDKAAVRSSDNALGLPRPMLAQPVAIKKLSGDYSVQRKYDGMRCLIHCSDGELMAYSRNGKPITSIAHILDQIQLPDGATIDGELYCHGVPLQRIMSWVKREQSETIKLSYHLYDLVAPDPFPARLARLASWGLTPVDTWAYSPLQLAGDMRQARAAGYEGLILRDHKTGYEQGKRSKSLIKVKEWDDDWFMIHDIKSSKDGWAILDCGTFTVSAPGTHAEKQAILEQKDVYIGQFVRVEFANLTVDGVPFHPVAVAISDHLL